MQITHRARLRVAALVIAGITAFTACSGDDGDALRIYSGRHYGIEAALDTEQGTLTLLEGAVQMKR